MKEHFEAKDLLNLGTRWRVGIGDLIRVWGDFWLNRDDNFFIGTPCVDGLEDLRVLGLLNENGMGWNLQLLSQLLLLINIFCIPLSISRQYNKRVWHYTHNGIYTVKFGFFC